MLPFHKMLERAFTGPVCSEHDFDMKILIPNLRKVVKKYDIKYDRTQPVPADDGLADRVWQAGLEFLEETGLFCPDTERRILFTRKEIDAALAVGPRGKVVGASHDARTIPRRFPEDKTPPFCSVGGVSVPMSTDANFISVVRAIGQNPLADAVANPSMTHVDGQMIVAASPLEVEGAIRGMIMAREGLRRAGRPDLAIVNACPAAAKAAGHIAGHRFGIGKGDALEIGTTAEMRIDFDSLNKIAFSLSTGSLVFGENGVILGGLAGGPEGTAVLMATYNPVDILVLRACCQHPFPTHFDLRTTSTRDTIWARSLGNQAAATASCRS